MRVLLSTTSGAGHFRPLLPLARALERAGHELACAAPAEAAEMVTGAGLRHLPFDGVPPDDPERAALFARLPGLAPEQARHEFCSLVFGRLNTTAALPGAHAAVAGFAPDLVVHELGEQGVRLAAETVGVPVVSVHPSLAQQYLTQSVASGIDHLRTGLGLEPDPDGAGLAHGPSVSWFPASVDVPEAPPGVRRLRDPELPPPSRVEDRDLVYVTLGSEAAGLPFFGPVLREAVTGALRAGLPVLVSTGRKAGGAPLDLPPEAEVVAWVDQAEVLGRARVVVCHGGAGTLLGALAAGVPVVAVPLFADQPDNAERLVVTGCGRSVAPVADAVAEAVRGLAADLPPGTVRTAQEVAALPPADEAVPWLERLAAERTRARS